MGFALVTGGTGLLGSHIAERLIARGDRVRALVRDGSDTDFLAGLGVEFVPGDLTDRSACDHAARGVKVVYHAAAKVGDWGPWAEFQRGCLDATDNLARAALDARVRRFVHISSTSAYGHPAEGQPAVDESSTLGQNLWRNWDYYTISKVECERRLWALLQTHQFPLTVIRPSWLYGERDRTTVARLVTRLRAGKVPTIGPGNNPLSAIYAGDVADAAILAGDDVGSVGEAYNVTDQGPITQRDYLDLWAEAAGAPPVRRAVSYPVTFAAAFALEAGARLVRRRSPPIITRYATWLMGRRLSYSTEKIRARLGWKPSAPYAATIARSVGWYDDHTGIGPTTRRVGPIVAVGPESSGGGLVPGAAVEQDSLLER